VLKKLLQAEKKLEQKKKVEKEQRTVRRLTHHQNGLNSEDSDEQP
jgi:hypothetical protein